MSLVRDANGQMRIARGVPQVLMPQTNFERKRTKRKLDEMLYGAEAPVDNGVWPTRYHQYHESKQFLPDDTLAFGGQAAGRNFLQRNAM